MLNLNYYIIKLEFFITVFYKPHQRTKHKYRSFLYPYLFSVEKPMHALNSRKVPPNKSLLCILIQTSLLHLPKRSFLIYKTRGLYRWSQNSSRHVIKFVRVNADWVLPLAALRNLQYNMVWKVRFIVFIKPSFEQISKKCYYPKQFTDTFCWLLCWYSFLFHSWVNLKYHLKRLL